MIYMLIFAVIIVAIGKLYFNSPSAKGKRSERAVAAKLEIDRFWMHEGKILTNIYIPKKLGETTEADVVYITRKGLIVVENKNYAGYIFGNELNKNWTVTLYAGKTWYGGNKVEKYHFYNPVWQNRTHIKYLNRYLGDNLKAFSLISFSDRGELKDITISSADVYICNHSKISSVIRNIYGENADVLTSEQIDEIYYKLLPLTEVGKDVKQKHIDNVQYGIYENGIISECPVCGSKLVLRTARKGANAGNQFYGCSNYPRCKYTRNVY